MTERELTAAEGNAESSLHGAAWFGDVEEVRRLIEGGADVNWRDSVGETALFGAAAWGNTEVVRYLLKVGARHDIAEQHGYTPFIGLRATVTWRPSELCLTRARIPLPPTTMEIFRLIWLIEVGRAHTLPFLRRWGRRSNRAESMRHNRAIDSDAGKRCALPGTRHRGRSGSIPRLSESAGVKKGDRNEAAASRDY